MGRNKERIEKTASLVQNMTLEKLYEIRKYCLPDMVMSSEKLFGFRLHPQIINDAIAAHEQFESIILVGEETNNV